MKELSLLSWPALTLTILLVSGLCVGADVMRTVGPETVAVAGYPGSTVGWAYLIIPHTAGHLPTKGVSSDASLRGIANAIIFESPVVEPYASLIRRWVRIFPPPCSFPPSSIYAFTCEDAAEGSYINSGAFTLSSALFGGNPADPASLDPDSSPEATATYWAIVANLPEPASFILLLTFLSIGGFLKLYQRTKPRRPVSAGEDELFLSVHLTQLCDPVTDCTGTESKKEVALIRVLPICPRSPDPPLA